MQKTELSSKIATLEKKIENLETEKENFNGFSLDSEKLSEKINELNLKIENLESEKFVLRNHIIFSWIINLFYRKKLKVSEANLKTNVEDLKEEKKESNSKIENLIRS